MSFYKALWGGWVSKYWWLRGIVLAFTLSAIVPTFVNLSKYEFLRAFHAVIISWNDALDYIGSVVGALVLFPDLDASAINAFLFSFGIGSPLFGYPVGILRYIQKAVSSSRLPRMFRASLCPPLTMEQVKQIDIDNFDPRSVRIWDILKYKSLD
ncbi:MAG: hypothetical protein AAFR02_07130, partial [Pseudomonadota bacterium]